MLVCIIDRNKWARITTGVHKGLSCLLNKEGNMCCLGFLGQSVGIPQEKLLTVVSPSEMGEHEQEEAAKYPTGVDWNTFIEINDDAKTTDAEKEAKLIELARANGFEFQFVTKE